MNSLELTEVVAKALKEPPGTDPFKYVCNLSLADLTEKLETEKLSGLVAPLWSAIEKLRDQSAATGAALNAKFAAEGDAFKGEMGFGGVKQYYGGALLASSSPVSVALPLSSYRRRLQRPCPAASFAAIFSTTNASATLAAASAATIPPPPPPAPPPSPPPPALPLLHHRHRLRPSRRLSQCPSPPPPSPPPSPRA